MAQCGTDSPILAKNHSGRHLRLRRSDYYSILSVGTAAAESKRIMMLHSFGRDSKPWSDYAKNMRGELERQSPWPLEITEHPLLAARPGKGSPEAAFAEYLRALYTERPLDLIVSFGAPAVAFVQRYRQQLFATTPMVFTAVEQRRVQYSTLTPNDTVVAVAHSFPAIFENILRVLPGTTTLAVVSGNSPNERFWAEEMRREGRRFADRISFVWYNDLPFEEVLKHAAALPPNSAIYWHLINVDAAGVVHDNERALRRLYAVANAPIFSYHDTFFGLQIVGGPMHSLVEGSRGTADVAIRILGGEKPSDIKIPPPDSPRRNSTGGRCNAGASASAGCCLEARSTSVPDCMGRISYAYPSCVCRVSPSGSINLLAALPTQTAPPLRSRRARHVNQAGSSIQAQDRTGGCPLAHKKAGPCRERGHSPQNPLRDRKSKAQPNRNEPSPWHNPQSKTPSLAKGGDRGPRRFGCHVGRGSDRSDLRRRCLKLSYRPVMGSAAKG